MSGRLAGLPVRRAHRRRERLRGLAWRRRPAPFALLIERCRSVHTFGMAWPLDLYWLDGDGRTVRVDRGVRPCRIKACRGASAVLEVPSGLPRLQQGDVILRRLDPNERQAAPLLSRASRN